MDEARAWVADCEWGEDAATLAALPDAAVRRGVDRHYAGGWAQFLADAGEADGYVSVPVGDGAWRVRPGSIAEGMARYAARHAG
jgi:hypothetical protein